MATRYEGAGASEALDKDQTRLNQIISHFHTKAALAICSARASLPQVILPTGEMKQDRWFNLSIDETDILSEHLYEWKRPDQSNYPAPPLQLEIYIDTSSLNSSQALVLVDDFGKRWDVADALASSADSSPQVTKYGVKACEVVLERWTVQLADSRGFATEELNDTLPNIYKKGVVFFRSFFTFLRLLPSWKLFRKIGRQVGSQQALKLKFRIKEGATAPRSSRKDSLYAPLCSEQNRNDSVVERHDFPPLLTPSGPLCCSVEYRQNSHFTVADAESLLSSRFLGLEEGEPTLAAGRSLPSSHTDRARERYSRTVGVGGNSPVRDKPRALLGAYGSLGTYHATEKVGSPVTELRHRAEQADLEDEADASPRYRDIPTDASRRFSISLRDNPPFKSGSLASSPKASPRPSPSTSTGKYEGSFLRTSTTPTYEASKRIPLSPRPQPTPRTASSVPTDIAVASSGSTSPRPGAVKFSSSFANRHKRFASHGSKTADSNASSGRGSSSSKEKSTHFHDVAGSGETTAGVGAGSSSAATVPGMAAAADSSTTTGKSDDDDIAAFISQIETAKDMKTFRGSPRSGSAGGSGSNNSGAASASDSVVVNLAKYTGQRETHSLLADEMSSSSLIHAASTTPPSRRLSNVPGLSTSSSPSRALLAGSHVPFVRSRLSTHSIVEEPVIAGSSSAGAMDPGASSAEGGSSGGHHRRGGSGSGSGRGGLGLGMESPRHRGGLSAEPAEMQEEEEDDEPFIFQQDNLLD